MLGFVDNNHGKEIIKMKKYLKFAGLCGDVFAFIAWILMMSTPIIIGAKVNGTFVSNSLTTFYGTEALFGDHLAGCATTAWVFALIAMVAVPVIFVLPLFKINVLDKWTNYINLGFALVFVICAILTFASKAQFAGDGLKNAVVGAGWVFAGIFYLIAACGVALPAVLNLIEKK